MQFGYHVKPSAMNLPTESQKVSLSFQEMLKATAGSPWRFSAVAAHCFGLEVAPRGLINTLKMALLLSLVQTNADANDTIQNLDLLVATSDTLVVDRLSVPACFTLYTLHVKHKSFPLSLILTG